MKHRHLKFLNFIKAALKFGKLFKELEMGVRQKKTSNVKAAQAYADLTEKLKTVEGTALENTAIFNTLSQKIKNMNPIDVLVKSWSDNVRVGNEFIEIFPATKELVKGLKILNRLTHFQSELFKGKFAIDSPKT